MIIIGFGHRKRVGKDTAGAFLLNHLRLEGKSATKKALAWKLKQQCYELFYWAGIREPEYYETHPKDREIPLKVIGKTPRQLWIDYGMAMRDIYEDIWVDLVIKECNKDFLIITDIRMPNEIAAIKNSGGFAVKISNPNVPYTPDKADTPLNDFNGWDHHIINDGSKSDLFEKVKDFYNANLR